MKLYFICRRKSLVAITAILIGIFIVSGAKASTLQVLWSGRVSELIEFSPEAVPIGVTNGSFISGQLSIDLPAYDHFMALNGSHSYGYAYLYSSGLSHTLRIGDSQWSVVGGGVTFTYYSYEPRAAFDILSNADNSESISYPNLVGRFDLGYAFLADNSPPIFSLENGIEQASFNLEQYAYAIGSLSCTLLDGNGDIVDGYSLTFDISSISAVVVPESSYTTLALLGTSSLCLRRKRE